MARKKVKLSWIASSSARKASLKRRRLGLIKKVMEHSTLCDIESVLVIYSPDENDPMVWPSHDEVKQQLKKFYQIPNIERMKKSMDLETYTIDRLSKCQDQLVKMTNKNNEVEVGTYMLQFHHGKMMADFDVNQIRGMIWLMQSRLTKIKKCVEYNKKLRHSSSGGLSQADVPLLLQPQELVGHGSGDVNASVGPHLGQSYGGILGIGPEFGLQGRSFCCSLNDVVEVPPSRPSFVGGSSSGIVAVNLSLPGPSFASSSSAAHDHGFLPFSTFISPIIDTSIPEGGDFGPFEGHDMGPGHYPLGPLGSGSLGSELGGTLFGFFGGDNSNIGTTSSNVAASSSEMGPFDEQHWPNNP